MKRVFLFLILLSYAVLAFATSHILAVPADIPPYPCDFYGTEETSAALTPGQIITAEDPDGTAIGQCTVVADGCYGFLSCAGDNPATPQDEGAVEGDIITFYIDGVKQQKQAVWKSGSTIKVDLGIPITGGAFNLHLIEMPEYTSYGGDIRYSGVAAADMILDFLDPANLDTQQDLMAYADRNADNETSASELERLLSNKAPSPYHFGSTATIDRYSDLGYIGDFDATNQDDCIKQVCHWMAYKVPRASQGKEYVPVAICTSSNPAASADSDYLHWMSMVGVKTNQDPYPTLPDERGYSDEFLIPQGLQLFGVYMNDPNQPGLGFHTYVAADIWANRYFRPIAAGLEGAGSYVAMMEPPSPYASPVSIEPASENENLQVLLETPQTEISIYIPDWVSPGIRDYLLSIFENLKQSTDFATLIEDEYFHQAIEGATVKRCYKVDGRANDDYTIIPFEKEVSGSSATTAAIIVNNSTGQLQIAFADPDANSVYMPMPWGDAYMALRNQIGWYREFPINIWLSNYAGNALFPGWSVVTIRYNQQDPIIVYNTIKYNITPEGEVTEQESSPRIKLLYNRVYKLVEYTVKLIMFEAADAKDCTVSIDWKGPETAAYLYHYENRYFLILRGPENSSCRLKAKGAGAGEDIRQGGITYIYAR